MISRNQFSPWDYVVFAAVLIVSAAIGIFYGCYKNRHKNNTEEFLLASREMSILPVTLSLLATFISAITLLGAPSEIYVYGTQYLILFVGYAIMVPVSAHLFLPIFYNLKITSVFQYLELRWKSKGLRVICAITYLVNMIMYLAIALYAPTLALNAVTGLNIWISILSVGIVCTFYTSLGGMKAVLWTDTFQILIMVAGMFSVIIKGSIDFGGFGNIWRISEEGGRIQFFDFDPNPFKRHTVWTLSFGGAFLWTGVYGVNQAQVQRGLCLPTLRQGQIAMWLNLPGLTALLFIAGLCGMVVYAQYKDCDPLSLKTIGARDQLLPLYVMDALAIPGIPGLFVASLFSASLRCHLKSNLYGRLSHLCFLSRYLFWLRPSYFQDFGFDYAMVEFSSISSALNSLSTITLQDFARYLCFPKMKEKTATLVSRFLSVGYGVVMIALTFLAANLGGVLEAAMTIFGMLGGPILGLFSLGMIYPCANYKGAYAGFLVSLLLSLWVGIGANVYKPGSPKLPVSTAGCYIGNSTGQFNISNMYHTSPSHTQQNISSSYIDTTAMPVEQTEQKAGYLSIYELSYVYYSMFAVITCHVVGLFISFITGGEDRENLDPKLISPIFDIFCCYLPQSLRKKCWCDVPRDKEDEKTHLQNGNVYLDDSKLKYIYDNPVLYDNNDKIEYSKQYCTHL